MQIKNKVILFVICILEIFFLHSFVHADEFNISASEIVLDKENNTVVGKGSVVATDSEGRIISADNIIYKKNKELYRKRWKETDILFPDASFTPRP